MARKRRESRLQTVNDINVTPLMDLTFLLLIVFMVTAPVLEYETDVSPPDMRTQTPVEEEREPLLVNLNGKGKIVFQRRELSLADLTAELTALQATRPDVAALIRADGERPYREVIDLMKAVRDANIGAISLVTQPES